MACSLKTLPFTQVFLQFFEVFGIKLYDFSAFHTLHMVVVAVTECLFINSSMFCFADLANEPAFTQKIYCSVY